LRILWIRAPDGLASLEPVRTLIRLGVSTFLWRMALYRLHQLKGRHPMFRFSFQGRLPRRSSCLLTFLPSMRWSILRTLICSKCCLITFHVLTIAASKNPGVHLAAMERAHLMQALKKSFAHAQMATLGADARHPRNLLNVSTLHAGPMEHVLWGWSLEPLLQAPFACASMDMLTKIRATQRAHAKKHQLALNSRHAKI